jgi:hypothetical protein
VTRAERPAEPARADDWTARAVAVLGPVLGPPAARLMLDMVRASVAGAELDPYVKHTDWPCVSRRAACELARSGELGDVKRVGHGRGALYLVRRSVLDAWIDRQSSGDAPPADDFEATMARRGFGRRGAP